MTAALSQVMLEQMEQPQQLQQQPQQPSVPVKEADVLSDDDMSESGGEEGEVGTPSKGMTSDLERPCGHNQWKKQTKKRGKLVLRCSVCSAVWKTRPELHQKCASFHAGRCQMGDNCLHPHIYARRETASLARRKARLAQEETPEVNTIRPDLFPAFYPSVQLQRNISTILLAPAMMQQFAAHQNMQQHAQLPPMAPCTPMRKYRPSGSHSESDGEGSDTSVPVSQASNSSGSLVSFCPTPSHGSTPIPLHEHSATGAEPYPYQLQYDIEDNLTPCRVKCLLTPSTPPLASQQVPKVWVSTSTWTHNPY
ncbi:hypothetical protein DIPPA_30441 [Diplonema papillatum]|nr:hypothetical protein DIPPA_30441 [Diplonema papillatum]